MAQKKVKFIFKPTHAHWVGDGFLVMNNEGELMQAIDDFNNGRFGTL